MTTDLAIKALRLWILHQIQRSYPGLKRLPVYPRADDEEAPPGSDAEEIDPPFISISDTGSEEHPILRGVLTVSLQVVLESVPGEADHEATPLKVHRAYASDLYNIVADSAAIEWCDGVDFLKCFDIRGAEPSTAEEGSRRVTTINLTMVCCPL